MVRILLLAAAAVVALAAPTAAQPRDPFVPLISEQQPVTDGATTGGAADGTAPDGAPADDQPVPGGLPDTGSSLSTPLALAYVLLAVGSAGLVLARVSRSAA